MCVTQGRDRTSQRQTNRKRENIYSDTERESVLETESKEKNETERQQKTETERDTEEERQSVGEARAV